MSSSSSSPSSSSSSPSPIQKRLDLLRSHLTHKPRTGRLAGQVCILTGAGSPNGIGRATSLLFAHEGAKALYCLDYSEDHLPSLQAEINQRYPDVQVVIVSCDCAVEESVRALVQRVMEEQGRLDVFFANAGIPGTLGPLSNVEVEDVAETMRVNVASCLLAIKHASPAMKTTTTTTKPLSGGSIILTASVAGLRSGAGPIDYSASKAAVISLAATSAWNLSRTNIRVNAICPGLIETGMTKPLFDGARQRGTVDKVGQLNPMGRYGVSEEIANVVLFLASDDSSYVNGIALPVCGGLSASHPVVPSGRMA